jgi:putative ABC transport system ATP-binding protein
MEAIIEARKVVKTYHNGKVEVAALRGVDLTITRGEMVAVMGPSGCGKTTLLNCLSGLDDISAGQVVIEGTDLYKMRDNARTSYRSQRMGFVFQFYNLLPVLSAIENVELPLLVAGINPKLARAKAKAALAAVGLDSRIKHRPGELSGGQRQRVTIARALVNQPAIVWADEPTGDLDSSTASAIMDLMRTLNREINQTFVIVTHDHAIANRCDRIISMSDGVIVDDSSLLIAAKRQAPALAERNLV